METNTKWSIDPAHSEIAFKVKHLMISNVKGLFREFNADISTVGNDFQTAQINFWANVSSIETGDKKRDEHLKSADFFDFEKDKKIIFASESIEKTNKPDRFTLSGNLTMKGITNRIKLDVDFGGIMKDPYGNEKAGITVTGKINRKDWGLNWNAALETGGVMVSEDVTIICEVELIKAKTLLIAEAEISAKKKEVAF